MRLVLLRFLEAVISCNMCFVALSTLYKCGKCPECLADKRREWSIRLQLHAMYSGQKPYIAHLTYDNEHVPKTKDGLLTLQKKDVQDFLKRLRYYVKESISYYIAGEYGPNKTHRPHYHCIIFGLKEDLSQDDCNALLQKAWKNGYVRRRSQWVKSYAQLHYVTKYVINFYDDTNDSRVQPFRLASNKFGIDYIEYARRNNLYKTEVQKLFECTTKLLVKKSHQVAKGYIETVVPDKWLKEQPFTYDFINHRKILNPILREFPDFVEIYEISNKDGKPKVFRYPLPRYFAERLYTRSFRLALAIKKEVESQDRSYNYLSRYGDYDKDTSTPYWLQLKRLAWQKKKKNYKDKLYYNSHKLLID